LADELVNSVSDGLGCGAVGGLAGERRSYEEGDFTAGRFLLEGSGEFAECTAKKFFVDFGDFAGEAGRAVAEDFFGVRNGLCDAMWGFVEDKRAIFEAESLEGAMAFAGAGGKKAHEEEFLVGKAGCREGSEERRRAWDGNYGDLMTGAEGDEAIARVADERHPCIANKGDFGALLHGDDELRSAGHFVVFVITDEGLRDLVVQEKFLRVAGVFAGDLVGLFEDTECAEGNVF
jgi:hypothetical protein